MFHSMVILELWRRNKDTREKKAEQNITFREDDINLLKSMCYICAPIVIRGRFLKKEYYSYYIPQNESDISLVKSLFDRNGINGEIYTTKMINQFGTQCVRVKLQNTDSENKIIKFMNAIQFGYASLRLPNNEHTR